MAEEAGLNAGHAAPEAGEKPAEQQPSPTGRTYTQQDLDAITEKVKATARKQWEAEAAEQRRQSEMTEAQKAQQEAEKAARELAETRAVLTRYERREAVLAAVDGWIPAEFIDAALNGANGDEFDAAAVAGKAKERWESSLARAGAGVPAAPKPPRTGGTPSAVDSSNLGSITSKQAQERAYEMNRKQFGSGTKWWNETVKPYLNDGGRFKEQ